jgi:phage shock protein A
MGFFSRISDIISANLNDLLERMEDPVKMMKQLIREMEQAVEVTREQLLQAVTNERRIDKEIAEYQRRISEWQARAVEAIRKGRDDLARKALELKKESQAVLAALESELPNAKAASTAIRTQLHGLQAKLTEAKRKQTILTTRRKVARIQKKSMAATFEAGPKPDALSEWERMEEKFAQFEAEVEAMADIAEGRAGDQELSEWHAANDISTELAALKEEIKGGPK